MRMIAQKTAVQVFSSGRARNPRVVRGNDGFWLFMFDVPAVGTGELQSYTLKTERGHLKAWSDPRSLFGYLDSVLGIKSGAFKLEEASNEPA